MSSFFKSARLPLVDHPYPCCQMADNDDDLPHSATELVDCVSLHPSLVTRVPGFGATELPDLSLQLPDSVQRAADLLPMLLD